MFWVVRNGNGPVLLAIAFLALVTRILPLTDPHDPWIDEAMLLANFPLNSVAGFLEPLPLFEQAAPLGYMAVLHVVSTLFPDDVLFAMRLASTLTGLIAAGLILASLHRFASGPVIPLSFAFVTLTPFIVRYNLEIKQYIFEFLATSLLLYASTHLLSESNIRKLIGFFAASVFAVLISFTAPIAIGAFGIDIIVERSYRNGWVLPVRSLYGFFAMLLAATLVFFIYYFGFTRPVTALQFTSWAFYFDQFHLSFPPLSEDALQRWLALPALLISQLEPIPQYIYRRFSSVDLKLAMSICYCALFVICTIAAFRARPFIAASFVCAILLIIGLSLLNMLPIALDRHFTFVMPVSAIILAFGISSILQWITGRIRVPLNGRVASACMVLVIATVGYFGYGKTQILERKSISPLLSHIAASDNAEDPVWVYYAAQPAMKILAPASVQQVGLVDHRSGPITWMERLRTSPDRKTSNSYFEFFQDTMQNHKRLWLVFSHSSVEPSLDRYMTIAERKIGGCKELMKARGTDLWRCDGSKVPKSQDK